VARAGEEADERRREVGPGLPQKRLDGAPLLLPDGQARHARDLADAERAEHVEVAFDGVLRAILDGRLGAEVREVVERAAGPPRVEALGRA
jgi:hypothetical protein